LKLYVGAGLSDRRTVAIKFEALVMAQRLA
jgi:hypothetical protein